MSNSKASAPHNTPFDHQRLMNDLNHLSMSPAILEIGYLGESILGRGIPIVTLGSGKKALLYVGAHHGTDWITSLLLVRFLKEFSFLLAHGGSACGI